MNIFIVNGFPGSGKTTFEEYVSKRLQEGSSYHNCYLFSSIDYVKQIAKQCGWNGTKDGRSRQFLSDLKQLLINFNDGPLTDIKKKINMTCMDYLDWGAPLDKLTFFVDVREPSEIEKFCQALKARSVFVRRSNHEQNLTNKSDAQVLDYNYDIYIDNNGSLDDLKRTVDQFISKYIIKSPQL